MLLTAQRLLSATFIATTLSLASLPSAAAQPGIANATPFGLEIGIATCDAARLKFGATTEKNLGGTDVLLASKNPSELYEGASEATVRCSNNLVTAVQFKASKGGMGAESSRAVYSGLSRKYKLVSGGPMPQLGDGYARLTSGNSIIEQSAPHLSFEFTVTYYEKSFYDSIVASNKASSKKSSERKQSAL